MYKITNWFRMEPDSLVPMLVQPFLYLKLWVGGQVYTYLLNSIVTFLSKGERLLCVLHQYQVNTRKDISTWKGRTGSPPHPICEILVRSTL